MKIKHRQEGEITVLELSGKIMGGDDFDLFKSTVDKLVEEGQIDVLLNMSKVKWINSTGLGLIVSSYSTIVKNGGRMKVCEVSDRIDNIFQVTQLELLFETFDEEAAGLKSFEDD
ncbi:MAG TPA: STAS domain-containing protein [Candidatus Krumholzibacteria bacterium]